ncbi:MAG: radical SAM protein [Planctomycetes bacterium]|nr:radical SAM protein [Planctomycetota bacterium]
MNIVLVSPPVAPFRFGSVLLKTRKWQPYSLAIVGAGCEQLGHDVRILDGHAQSWTLEETARNALDANPDILIYSSARHDAWELPTPDFQFIFDFFEILRSKGVVRFPVAIEGPHGTLEPERLFNKIPELRYLARHEPETPLLRLIQFFDSPSKFAEIDDLSYRDASGDIIHNRDGAALEDLDALPMPAFHLLPMDRYREHGDDNLPFSLVVTSRGCPMPCGYCFKEMFGSRLRVRSIPRVMEELDLLINKYGVRRIFFHDQIFTLNRRRTHELCGAMIAAGYNKKLTWRCQTRLNGMKEETLDIMKQAGCVEIQTGLESAAPEIQDQILKLTVEEFIKYRSYGERIGLRISPNNIIGLPGETFASALASLKFYHRLGIPYAPNFHFPYPTTPFYKKARAAGEIGDGSFEAIGPLAGRVGNALTEGDLAVILKSCARWNRWLRVKQRIWRFFNRTYGSLVPEARRGAVALRSSEFGRVPPAARPN